MHAFFIRHFSGSSGGREYKGSLTAEAGLAFSVFIFALLAVCCIFRYLAAEYAVEKSMLAVARMLSPYPEIAELADEKRGSFLAGLSGGAADTTKFSGELTAGGIAESVTDGILIGSLLKNELHKNRFAAGSIKNEEDGLNCLGSVLFTDDEKVLIKCSYRLKLPVSMFGLGSIPVEQQLEYRYFTGLKMPSMLDAQDAEDGQEDRIVYITEEKKVYHQSLDCPSLRLVVRSCPITEVDKERNLAGGKYYKCERCARGTKPAQVYISKEGDRFHYNRNCGGLKRSISKIRLSEASLTRRPCKRCMPK